MQQYSIWALSLSSCSPSQIPMKHLCLRCQMQNKTEFLWLVGTGISAFAAQDLELGDPLLMANSKMQILWVWLREAEIERA